MGGCQFCSLFLKQFFDIGNAAGSIITEAIGLFRTFQCISAPKSFSTRFSRECLEMFKWATRIIELITENIQTTPLTTYESFTVYSIVIPLTILIFISSIILGRDFGLNIIIYGFFLAFGAGFGFIQINNKLAIGLTVASAVLIGGAFFFTAYSESFITHYFFEINRFKSKDLKIGRKTGIPFFFSACSTCFFFFLLCTHIFLRRMILSLIAFIAIAIALFIMSCFDGCYTCCCKCCSKKYTKVGKLVQKECGFFINCLQLLIIPSTELFVELMQSNYKNRWCIILTYLFVSLLLPMSMVLITILTDHPNICDKYKTPKSFSFNFYYYVELIDIVKQVVYAIFATYDIIWGCVATEICWFIFIIVLRPYKAVSDYSLTVGNSLLVFISNGAILYSEKHESGMFSFKFAFYFVLVCCIPAILSIYLFFIFDADFDEEDSDDERHEDQITFGMGYVAAIITPLVWLFYGTNMPLISNYVKIQPI